MRRTADPIFEFRGASRVEVINSWDIWSYNLDFVVKYEGFDVTTKLRVVFKFRQHAKGLLWSEVGNDYSLVQIRCGPIVEGSTRQCQTVEIVGPFEMGEDDANDIIW